MFIKFATNIEREENIIFYYIEFKKKQKLYKFCLQEIIYNIIKLRDVGNWKLTFSNIIFLKKN